MFHLPISTGSAARCQILGWDVGIFFSLRLDTDTIWHGFNSSESLRQRNLFIFHFSYIVRSCEFSSPIKRSVLKMCPLWNRLCLTAAVEDFISCISVTSTTINVIACTLHIQVHDTWQCLSAILKTVAKTNLHLYMYFSLLFFLAFLLTCGLN